MPFVKGYKPTKEQRRKQSLARLGVEPVNKGKHIQTNTGRTHFKKGQLSWNKGKKGIHFSPLSEFKKGHGTGEKNNRWKGGVSKVRGYGNIYKERHRLRKLGAEGFHTVGEWDKLKIQYNFVCPNCKKQEPKIKLEKDHIVPISKGGSNNIENIQPLCRSCNAIKNTKIMKYELL